MSENLNTATLALVPRGDRLTRGGEPPHTGNMEARVQTLEKFAQDARERLTRIETKLDHSATKADLADMKADMVKWIVGTAIALGSAAIVVMTFVLNNATPKPPAAQQPAPAVIVVPGSAASH